MTVTVLVAVTAGLLWIPSAGKEATSPDPFQEVQARHADAFVETVGVGIHLRYTDTAYFTAFDSVIRPRLEELGVRYVRDHAHTASDYDAGHFYYTRLRALAELGLRFLLVTDIETQHRPETDWELLDDVHAWTGNAIWAFSGPNEPDGMSGLSEPEWVQRTRAAQRRLWDKVRSDPALADVRVVGPALVTWRNKWAVLGDLSSYLDYGNWHPYPGASSPTRQAGRHDLAEREAGPMIVSGGKPLVVTESGYHNAVNARGRGHFPASERAAAVYVPRLLLEYFNRGYERTFLYELIDLQPDPSRTDQEHNFGLLRNDGRPKPAFVALRNLIHLLEDPGPASTPETLRYSLEGATTGVHSVLLQKRDGRFYLALWQDASVWDREARQDRVDRAPQRVVVRLEQPAAQIAAYMPNASVEPVRTWAHTNVVSMAVTPEVTLVEVTP